MTQQALDQLPVSLLKSVGPQLETKLQQIGIASIQDLLFHLPYRYEDRTRVTPVGSARPFQHAVIEAEILAADIIFGKRRSLVCKISDGTGVINLRFFHFSNQQKAQLGKGSFIRCYGEVRKGSMGLEIYHPEYQVFRDTPPPLEEKLTPYYPLTSGISQQKMRYLLQQSLAFLSKGKLEDFIPEAYARQHKMPPLQQAIEFIHNPPRGVNVEELESGEHAALQRLCLEELAAQQLGFVKVRQQLLQQAAVSLPPDSAIQQQLLSALPFTLTTAQEKVFAEISHDLSGTHPMLRLVQGDVGSGKTMVAIMAALQCIASNKQAAVMAPTEILSQQHYHEFRQRLAPLGIHITWLTGSMRKKQKQEALENIRSGKTQVAIGTHALFQEEVTFHDLAFIVVDEQHRFGVHQRLSLKEKARKNTTAHQLIMTATPIPRSLAMSVYGDLDHSIIDELPAGRKPVETVVLADSRKPEVIQRIHKACLEGKQSYWVCTLIEESESLQCQAAENTYAELVEALPDIRIGLVHGRMKPAEKAEVMEQFKQGEVSLLVATTVIEVGVNVPNASLMIIENPERLGLAQLHQLRGRVGRGNQQSYCVLLYGSPLSESGKARLNIMRSTTDGFEIAERDLEIRGPGEVLGTRQTGLASLKIADLARDEHLLEPARKLAEMVQREYPQWTERLIQRWLFDSEKFAGV